MDILPPYLNVVTVGSVSLTLVLYYLFRRSSAGSAQKIPTPAGAWPIIGHLPLLGGTDPPHKTLGSMADKYGPLFTVHLGLQKALVLNSWESAKECFTTNDLAVSSRPQLVASKHIGYNDAMFGFAPFGPYWRELRKITSIELLSNNRLDLLSHVRATEIETSLEELYQLWTTKKNDLDQILVELKQWFGDMSLNVILKMVAGKRYQLSNTIEAVEKKEAHRCQKAVGELAYFIGSFVLSDAIPFLGWLDWGGNEKAMKKTGKELDSLFGKWLEEHKLKRASGEVKGEQDFMDTMLSVLDGADLDGYDADTINKATSLNMIAAGSETTTVTLTWAISLLLNNHHMLKKAQDELDIHVGKERIVKESDISKLVYIQAIVKETLRLYPAAPLSGPREFTEDCIIGGYRVPRGTRLITNIWKIQTDPRIWSDPLEFKPERFLTTHKDVDVWGKHFELIPFGSGRRACPGTSFALRTVHLALARFLQTFEISKPSYAQVDMTESFGLTNMKATPLEVLITPRLHSTLYGLKTKK